MSKNNPNKYTDLQNLCKKIMKEKREPAEDEQFFDDDPRAVNELEYGKIKKRYTHIETRNVLDEF